MEFIDPKLDDYCVAHSSDQSNLLAELERETWAKVLQPRMISGDFQGRFLSMISKLKQPKAILEIGTYSGFSALCLAEGLSLDGELHTIDINEELETIILKYFNKSEYKDQLHFHIGNALDLIPELNKKWDIVFIDADKTNYSNYYDLLIDQLEPGALIIADNVLWSSKVIQEVDAKDYETQALLEYNDKIQSDPRVENILLPVRDGLMMCRVK